MHRPRRAGGWGVWGDCRPAGGPEGVFGGVMPAGVLYAPESFIQANPKTTQALANAMVRADRWLQRVSPDDLLKVVPQAYWLNDKALYVDAFKNVRDAYSPDGLMPDGAPQTALRALASFNPQLDASKVDLSQTWTNDFVKKAAAAYKE